MQPFDKHALEIVVGDFVCLFEIKSLESKTDMLVTQSLWDLKI